MDICGCWGSAFLLSGPQIRIASLICRSISPSQPWQPVLPVAVRRRKVSREETKLTIVGKGASRMGKISQASLEKEEIFDQGGLSVFSRIVFPTMASRLPWTPPTYLSFSLTRFPLACSKWMSNHAAAHNLVIIPLLIPRPCNIHPEIK